MVTDEGLSGLTLAKAAAAIAAHEVAPLALVEATLRRAESYERFNAFVTLLGERALEQARRVERSLSMGDASTRLAGIPVALKDNIPLAGAPTTACSNLLRDWVPERSAEVVERLENSGGVVIGKTTMWELAYGAPNPAFGDAVNPWSPDRLAGPSSSGAAVAVSLELCFAALATDSGGSIRIPAAYCGVVGFKPTRGVLPTDGVIPVSRTLDHVGPITRTVEDFALVIDALTGRRELSSSIDAADPRGMRIAVPTIGALTIDPAQRAALESALRVMEDHGAHVEEIDPLPFEQACAVKWAISSPEAAAAHQNLIAGRKDQLQPGVRRLLDAGAAATAVDYIEAQQCRRDLRRTYDDALDGFDVLFCPTVPSVAPVTATIEEAELVNMTHYTSLFNVVGAPAVTVPAGLSQAGLPVAIQVAGRPGADAAVVRAAVAYERASRLGVLRPPA